MNKGDIVRIVKTDGVTTTTVETTLLTVSGSGVYGADGVYYHRDEYDIEVVVPYRIPEGRSVLVATKDGLDRRIGFTVRVDGEVFVVYANADSTDYVMRGLDFLLSGPNVEVIDLDY